MAGGWERLSGVEMRAAAARFAKHTVAGRLHVVFLLDGSGSVTEGAPCASRKPGLCSTRRWQVLYFHLFFYKKKWLGNIVGNSRLLPQALARRVLRSHRGCPDRSV